MTAIKNTVAIYNTINHLTTIKGVTLYNSGMEITNDLSMVYELTIANKNEVEGHERTLTLRIFNNGNEMKEIKILTGENDIDTYVIIDSKKIKESVITCETVEGAVQEAYMAIIGDAAIFKMIEDAEPNPTAAQLAFTSIWEGTENEIEFSSDWENGTGYFDGVTRATPVAIGERYKCVTPDNRRLIVVGTKFGNLALFERYSQGVIDRSGIICCNAPRALKGEIYNGALTSDAIICIVGEASAK